MEKAASLEGKLAAPVANGQGQNFAGRFLTGVPCSLSQTGWTRDIQQPNRERCLIGDHQQIRGSERNCVPFCNALFRHQRQVCVDATYLGLSCNSNSTSGAEGRGSGCRAGGQEDA